MWNRFEVACHTSTHSSYLGTLMKVEITPEAQKNQFPDQPRLNDVVAPQKLSSTSGIDELASVFSQEAARNNQPLEERSFELRVPPIEQFKQLYKLLSLPADASLSAVARRVRLQLLQRPGVGKLVELTGGDPARTYVVLKHVLTQAKADVRETEEKLAEDALAKLEVRYKGEIQAGLNIAMTLHAACGDPQECQAIRTLYYASVVQRQSLGRMMQALLGVYGGERFSAGLMVMRKALADDIAAHTPSVPTAQLRTLLLGLQSCGQLSAVLGACQMLIHRLSIAQDAVSLLQRLLGYAGTGIAPAEIQNLAQDLADGGSVVPLVLLNALYPLIQQLPIALWSDQRGRHEALHNFLLVMDEYARIERGSAYAVGLSRALV
jgi:type III secretion protein W